LGAGRHIARRSVAHLEDPHEHLSRQPRLQTANIPIVPESPPPDALYNLKRPLVVGLTTGLDRLVQVRRNRLLSLNQAPETAYVDDERVKAEIAYARRMFADNGWPVIDVTRRSIEETAAAVIKLVEDRGTA
jgi:regulator of PEP synthase PpsR (kinase-PPPase family)